MQIFLLILLFFLITILSVKAYLKFIDQDIIWLERYNRPWYIKFFKWLRDL